MKITVLAGGLSPERDVSLSSGRLIANALRRGSHKVALIDPAAPFTGDAGAVFTASEEEAYTIPGAPPDLDALRSLYGNGLLGEGVREICAASELVFVALHGGTGEDGTLQAELDGIGVPYTGSGSESCRLAMDKSLSKLVFAENDIKTAPYSIHSTRVPYHNVKYPCVVKPCSCGSSVGVTIVSSPDELADAVMAAREYEDKVLIEDKIEGREFSVGILGGRALPPIEIRPKDGFYDFTRKYQAGMTDEICPAELSAEETERISEAALAVHKALGLGDYSRSDFIRDGKTGEFICLEANTLPGMTPVSLLPREAKAAGIGYDELCEFIAELAVKRCKNGK